MNDIEFTYREFYLYVIVGGAILGALLGLILLFLGRRKGQGRLGLYGFVASIVAGAIAPILSVVVVAIFAWMITKSKPAAADQTPDAESHGGQDPQA